MSKPWLRSACRWHRLTMIDLLTALVASLLVSSVMLDLYNRTSRLTRQVTQQVWNQQELGLIHQEWQRLVQASSPTHWQVANGAFVGGPACEVRLTDDAAVPGRCLLVFTTAERRKVFPLDGGATVDFAIERDAGLAPAAVLNLHRSTGLGPHPPTSHLRLLACPAKENTDALPASR